MVLYFRLIWMLIKLYFDRSKVDLMQPFVREFSVLYTDVDIFRHMTNSRYFALMDLTRVEFLVRAGFYNAEHRHKYTGFAGLLLARFRKQLKRGDRFQIIYRIVGYTEDAIYMDVRFVKDNYIHCHAIEKQMIYELHKGVAPTAQVFEMLGHPAPKLKTPKYIQKVIAADIALKDLHKTLHEHHSEH